MDYKAIRKIWYNTEPLVDGSERTELHRCSQLAAYIMSHPYLANTSKDCRSSENIAGLFRSTKDANKEDLPNLIIFGTQGGTRHRWDWLGQLICHVGPTRIRAFVGAVEAGMTVYDWPTWAMSFETQTAIHNVGGLSLIHI